MIFQVKIQLKKGYNMTTSLQSILSENYQENRDYELEEKIISCFKSEDENAFLEIKEYLPIKNEALINNIIDIPEMMEKIKHFEEQNSPLIDWYNVVRLLEIENNQKYLSLNEERITTNFIKLIEMGYSDYIINILKQQSYSSVEFFEKVNHHTGKVSIFFEENKKGKNNIFAQIEKHLNFEFDRQNLCINFMYHSILNRTDCSFPDSYESFKSIANIFEIKEEKDLFKISVETKEKILNNSMESRIRFIKCSQNYDEILKKIKENMIKKEQLTLNEILSVNKNNPIEKTKKRI